METRNCREKKIKCEPGEKSCLQCEKAKRECHRFASPRLVADRLLRNDSRPTVPQSPAELVNTTLNIPNLPLGRAEWSSQSSGSIVAAEAPNQKRRRSAQAAQQDVLNLPPTWNREESPQSVKRRRSAGSADSLDMADIERQRKDSKRVDLEDMINPPPRAFSEKLAPSSWDQDPYLYDPEATMRFVELFFAQSAREVSIMFPRGAFTRWVRTCRDKCQRECMALYAVLAMGSIFAENEFSSFAKICAERASQAVSMIDGKFSLAIVQARLLVAGYNHLVGRDSTGWDLSGSALRIISAMRLNTEEGCGEDLDEFNRRYFSFSSEQLKECRRRTFWTAFLVDVSAHEDLKLIHALTLISDTMDSVEGCFAPYNSRIFKFDFLVTTKFMNRAWLLMRRFSIVSNQAWVCNLWTQNRVHQVRRHTP
jgi:hypothetical protein